MSVGAQYVSIKIANSLPQGTVHLSCPVRKVVDHGDHVQVIISPKLGQPRSVLARKLIVSVPTPLYKDITFSPPLEGDTLAAVSNTKLGFYSKVIAVYSEPWWTKKSLCGLLLSYVGPIVVARDTSTAVDKQYSLTCFVNGSTGREWSKLPPHARKMRVLQHLKEITGEEQAMNPLDVLEQQWTKEEWSQGAVCPISGPGVMSSVGHMWPKSVGNFHFVGTEFAREWKGYMEGALCSGEDGAQEVLKELEMAAVVGSKL
jgi:monoamine oxidase